MTKLQQIAPAPPAPSHAQIYRRRIDGKLEKELRRPASLAKGLVALDAFLRRYMPEIWRAARLRPPASAGALGKLQKLLGVARLPPVVRTLFSWHDGQDGDVSIFSEEGDLYGRLMRVSDTMRELRMARDVPLASWNPRWIPMLDYLSGNYLVVDPKRGEEALNWDHEEPDAPYSRRASIGKLFLRAIATWPYTYRRSHWLTTRFDLESVRWHKVGRSALHWKALATMGVGGIVLARTARHTQALMRATLTKAGSHWVDALGGDRREALASLKKALTQPLPRPRFDTALNLDLMLWTKPVVATWFGYAPITGVIAPRAS